MPFVMIVIASHNNQEPACIGGALCPMISRIHQP